MQAIDNMRKFFSILILATLSIGLNKINAQEAGQTLCFNHSLLVLDSTTYDALLESKFLASFAFSHEKHLSGYHGFYMIGRTNYIELFHEGSFDGETLDVGTTWICLAALKVGVVDELVSVKYPFITTEKDENFNSVSVVTDDTSEVISLREMQKSLYEGWAKKSYHDSVTFLPVDYNSPAESDSSKNYFFRDIKGIDLEANTEDIERIRAYLKLLGFKKEDDKKTHMRFEYHGQFIELFANDDMKSPKIRRFHLTLNRSIKEHIEPIGNSTLQCKGLKATWTFDRKSNNR